MEFAQGAFEPQGYVVNVDDLSDGRGGRRQDAAVLEGGRRSSLGQLEKTPERGHRFLSAGQAAFEALEVGDDDLVASGQVGSSYDRSDLVQGHVQRPEAADHLSGRDLVSGVAPVAGGRVDVSGFEESDPVVVVERLDAQMRRSSEVSNREG